ncbi:DUF5677 domain-containing protein [Clostridium perfringens]|nr:DUF5677 domain-containing protein [Clostridium perfringens]
MIKDLETYKKKVIEFYENDNYENIKIWGDAYTVLDIFNIELYNYNNTFKNILNIDSKFDEFISKSLDRNLRIFNEILVLLKNGFPEGALARWRSLYENIIIMVYMMRQEDKEEITEKYINNRKWISDNQKDITYNDLKAYITCLNEEESLLKSIGINNCKEYTKDEGYDDYSWSGERGFAGIQKKVEVGDFYYYYKYVCKYVHSGSYSSLNLINEEKTLRTSESVEDAIDITLQVIMFLLENLNINIIGENSEINQCYEKLVYINNWIVTELKKIKG